MLRHKAIAATIWSGADMIFRQGIGFAVALVLARLLGPEEFGTIALMYLFTGIASIFVDSGFSAALIRAQDATHADESTVFWFNLLAGAVVGMLLWQSGTLIADFYQTPELVPLAAAMGLNVLLSAFGSIHGTLLTKKLDFRTQMRAGVAGATISGAVAIAMAMYGFGVWALAVQILVATGSTTALLWILHPWRPALTFSPASARRLFGFGGYMLAAGFLNVVYERMYSLLIGRMFGARELGFYDRAHNTQQLPAAFLANILARVAYPVFSAVSHDRDKLRSGVRLAVRGIMLINLPLMFWLASAAEPAIVTLFGEQWRPAAPMLAVLCLGGALWPLHVINLHVLMAQGHSKLVLKVQFVKQFLGLGFLAIGALFGVMGIAWSTVAFGIAAFLVNAHYTERHLAYGAIAQVRDFGPTLAVALLMAAGVHVAGRILEPGSWLEFPLLACIGLVLFAGVAFGVRLGALADCLALLRAETRFARPTGAD